MTHTYSFATVLSFAALFAGQAMAANDAPVTREQVGMNAAAPPMAGGCKAPTASLLILHASFPRSVTLTQLRFTSFAAISLWRDLHPQESYPSKASLFSC